MMMLIINHLKGKETLRRVISFCPSFHSVSEKIEWESIFVFHYFRNLIKLKQSVTEGFFFDDSDLYALVTAADLRRENKGEHKQHSFISLHRRKN